MYVREEARSAGIRVEFFTDAWADHTTPLLDTLALRKSPSGFIHHGLASRPVEQPEIIARYPMNVETQCSILVSC